MMWGVMGFGFLVWVVVLAVLVAGVWWLAKEVRPDRRDHALEVLRERYARGEISREEYEARRKDLAA